MKLFVSALILFLSACSGSQVKKSTVIATLTGETKGLAHCESVVYDKKRGFLYVSVQADKVAGDGSIAIVSLEGKILNDKFITGLDNPKGLALHNDTLYVSDVTTLVEIDVTRGRILKKYKGKGAKFLNDVALDSEGNVYVSDMHRSSIYKLNSSKEFYEWMNSPDLENPNGLLIQGNDMYVAAWGKYSDDNPRKSPPGNLHRIDIKNKKSFQISTAPIGHLDGIQAYDKNSFVVSSWLEGMLHIANKNGQAFELLDTEQSVGDHLYIAEKRLLVLPMNVQNKIMFYTLSE